MAGISETKDALAAAVAILGAAKRVGADGWKMSDAGFLITDKALTDAVARALNGAEQIPAELSNLSFSETIELVTALVGALPKTIDK